MDFDRLLEYRRPLERRIEASFREQQRRVPAVFRPYLDAIAEFTLRGGKRFRALLLLAGYWLASRKDPSPALPAAAALEHFQSWMLVHDDIMDHAETRRGGPTLHRIFEASHRARHGLGDAADFGVGIGITLGDLEEPFTIEGLTGVSSPADRRLRALAEYVRMTRETAYGQLLDVENGTKPVSEVREEDVLEVHRRKSAFYTVSSPLRIGAILGGARPPLLALLESVGLDFGVAFQLRDDVLGAGFNAAASGKSANDLVEGKRTLLVVRAWQRSDERGRAALEEVLGHPDVSDSAVEAAREVIRSSGSLAYSEERIATLTRQAHGRIDRNESLRNDGRDLMHQIGDRLVDRVQ